MSHSFIQNCCWITYPASFTSSRINDLCQKTEGKANFPGAPTCCQEPGWLSVWKSLT